MDSKRIAIVVQRYGADVLGGSESLARSVAHCLASAYKVDVLTTCASDYMTWNNVFPDGESNDGPVRVIRFKTDHPRSRHFNFYNGLMLKMNPIRMMEKLWMRMQGPYSSSINRYMAQHADDYDLFIFFTYLYGTSYYGMKLIGDRAILVPTAHDEPYIRFGIYRDMFLKARKLVFLTEEEQSFVEGMFGLDPGNGEVIGAPLEIPIAVNQTAFREKYGIYGDFILYAGRIDPMKGVDQLLDYFNEYSRGNRRPVKLVLCGHGPMTVPRTDRIIPIGFVPDEDKYAAMSAAIATVQPSLYESYSITAIESMLCATPIMANGKCEVLKGHCEKSGGGLCYTSCEEFAAALDTLLENPSSKELMGKRGLAYAIERYSADAIRKKYISTIEEVIS